MVLLITLTLFGAASGIAGVFMSWSRNIFLSHILGHAAILPILISIHYKLPWYLHVTVLYGFGAIFAFILSMIQTRSSKYNQETSLIVVSFMCMGMALLASEILGESHELAEILINREIFTSSSRLYFVCIVNLIIIAVYYFLWRIFLLQSIDVEIAQAYNKRSPMYSHLMMITSSILTISGIEIMGLLLASATITIPIAIAQLCDCNARNTVIMTIIISTITTVACYFIQMALQLESLAPIVIIGYTIIYFVVLGLSVVRNAASSHISQ